MFPSSVKPKPVPAPIDTSDLLPMFCEHCKKEILRAKGDADLEIVCLNCRWTNYPTRKTIKERLEGLKGKNFLSKSLSHYCWKCHRLLFRSRQGDGIYEKFCNYCKVPTVYDTLLMKKGVMKFPESSASKKSRESIAF